MKKSMLDRMATRAAEAKSEDSKRGDVVQIPMSKLRFNPNQPRKDFHAIDGHVPEAAMTALKELADDMEANGQIQPIVVRELDGGDYEVVIGERRSRAAMLNKWETIEAKIRNDLVGVALQLYQLAENIQREDLNENDLASFIHAIVQSNEMSKQNLAKMFKKPASWVTRYLSYADPIMQAKWVQPGYVDKAWILYALLQLPEELQNEALEICRAREGAITSKELKALEARAKQAKEAAAQQAAQSAVAQAPAASQAGKGKPAAANESGAQAGASATSAPITALFGADPDATASDGYSPNAAELAALRQSPAGASGGGEFVAPENYAGDNAARDLSGHEAIANMHRMHPGATATVTSRVSLDQLVAVQRALEDKDVGAQMRGVAVEFRADESLLREVLAGLGVDATNLPTAVLSLKLIEVAQGLVSGA
ncbi:ParB/RepB/Spo0J family partition protein [Burkholderia cenocepacia]|uniref:ParB/RepB/Spo0J family partition protein n=1 Tax=Burkholderia cenocepacia TaxID=95486 RepID=UPI0013DEAB29|nr:ParB/RepB/Spo0J family partition protein [Burkholderia cenocepacia]MCW3587409.1 ParB/RepB/Spo0J family partition protein [Burkholderia cenocepacia]MCW3632613.1 ParB/RepB/Spo0J family partition protein [Burkholderia cenocepacia]MCW5181844.1 ParB/RepB/Spo0J family partition protein [Burkholderia cenocepacia]NGO98026.1 hypothetical protein [Burkholderia cenocepacia]